MQKGVLHDPCDPCAVFVLEEAHWLPTPRACFSFHLHARGGAGSQMRHSLSSHIDFCHRFSNGKLSPGDVVADVPMRKIAMLENR